MSMQATRAPAARRAVLADPLYYLANFERLVGVIERRYADLLDEEERGFLAHFGTLPTTARALLVRMIMRKGTLFRVSRLNYTEIGASRAAAAPLRAAGWLDDRPVLTLDQLQGLLTRTELVVHCGLPCSERHAVKPLLVAALRGRGLPAQSFDAWCPRCDDGVMQLLIRPLCERFRLLFFGNFRQSWAEFVLADLGVFAYERIAESQQSRPFHSRAHIEVFQRLFDIRERLHGGGLPDDVDRDLPPAIADCEWLEERRQKLRFQIAREHERRGNRRAAAAIYADCTHTGSLTRAIRIHEFNREWTAAAALCRGALMAPTVGASDGPGAAPSVVTEAEGEHLRRVLRRLTRRLGGADVDRDDEIRVPQFDLVLPRAADAAPSADATAVELRVRDHLSAGGGGNAVHYVENALINSLFGLLFWDAIFAPVAGAFFHEFHHGPADLTSARFQPRRQREFSDCFARLGDDRYRSVIRRNFRVKAGLQSPFVAWAALSEPLLESALDCFPAGHLRRWFEWILRDVQRNRAGFPDLVEFSPARRSYRLIEVKAPGDRLRDNQRRLLQYCASNGMPVAVCRVRWVDHAG